VALILITQRLFCLFFWGKLMLRMVSAVILAAAVLVHPASATVLSVTSQQYAYPVTGFETPDTDGKSLYVIGVYEADTDHTQSYTANVVVDAQGGRPLYLTLVSYEGVDWTFSGSGVGDIVGILLSAYTSSSVVGVDSALISAFVGPLEAIGYGYSYPSDPTNALIAHSANFFGAPVDGFIGSYTANGFAIAAPAGVGGVPEPASWAMLIAGFGLVGATMRRRPARVAA
jgi:PEP-CTERM motif